MLVNNTHLAELNSPNQTIRARVELYKGSTLEKICNCGDLLSDFTVEKPGGGKFFGYGICQKLKANLVDIDREIDITKEHTIEASFGANSDFVYPFPIFYVEEIERDETSNFLTVTAYDALYKATNHTVEELALPASYNLLYFASACAALLGVSLRFESSVDITPFLTNYAEGANFEGTETVRAALDAVAEATQTIYYINSNWDLTFKRLDKNAAPALTIEKANYLELATEGARTLGAIVHTTELEDSVTPIEPTQKVEGVTQYVRDNPFWDLRQDIGTLVDNAQTAMGGISIEQFDCNWMGNYLLELGDKIAIIAEDNSAVNAYVLDDTVTFDGTLSQVTKWAYNENEAETASNPTSLGDALNKTFARVDKVNKRIDLVVSDVDGRMSSIALDVDGINLRVQKVEEEVKAFEELETGEFIERIAEIELELDGVTTTVEETKNTADSNTTAIGALQVSANTISASVSKVEETTQQQIDSINDDISLLQKQASLTMTEDAVKVAIETELSNGVNTVRTEAGYTFNDDGLLIERSDSEISTNINHEGMVVSKNDEAVLTATNTGVDAVNLRATTYLIVGGNSRFETFESNGETRTACFWIGG